jgi:Na+-transporting NADH:ubiquinone oxidoreductase subunit NqrB
MDTLNTLAQAAIALAGFASVVIVVRRRDHGHWHQADAARFTSMIVHALHGAGFAFVPQMLRYFLPTEDLLWAVSSLALGISTLLQAFIATRLELVVSRRHAAMAFFQGMAIFVLQLANLFSWLGPPGPGLFVVGVFWHTLQAGFLFFMLVKVQPERG